MPLLYLYVVFDSTINLVDLKFSVDFTLPDSVNAATNNDGEDFIRIKFNGNTLSNRTELGLVRTFAHETIHAELYRKVRSVNNLVSITNFPGIFDYYTRYKSGWQHEQMAAHYRESIVYILKQYDNGAHTDEFYQDLAWEGLIGTVTWNELGTTEQIRIKAAILDFKDNGNKTCN